MGVQEVLNYLKIIRKWWWVIALIFVATIGTMLAVTFLTETQYEATVTVQVSAPPPEEVPLYSEFGRQALRDEIAQTRTSFSELVLEGDVVYRVLETLPDVPMRGSELRETITIEKPESLQLLYISVRAADPETAALLANTVVELGLQRYGELRAQPTANTRQFIELELEAARAELKAAEAELAQFQIDNKFATLNRALDSQYSLIRSIKTQHDLALSEGDIARARALEAIVLEREAELQNIIGLSAEYSEFSDRVERARKTHDFLLDRLSESRIKENQILDVGYIQIITPAFPPRSPVAAINSKLIALGAVASLLAGVLMTFLLEYLEISRGFQRLSKRPEMVALSENSG